MSFNHACPDVPAPVIADSVVLLGPVWVGADTVLARGVVRSHEATVSIDNHSAVLENSGVVGTSSHPVTIGQRTVFGHRLGWSDEAGGGRVPDWVEVGCYAGGRGDETPRVVLLGGREVTLRVERRWIEEPVGSSGDERRRMFQVQLEDGRRCRLAQESDGSWTLSQAADGR